MTNQPIKFEVPNFTRYGNMKGDAKGSPKVIEKAPFDRARTSFY